MRARRLYRRYGPILAENLNCRSGGKLDGWELASGCWRGGLHSSWASPQTNKPNKFVFIRSFPAFSAPVVAVIALARHSPATYRATYIGPTDRRHTEASDVTCSAPAVTQSLSSQVPTQCSGPEF